LFQLSFVSFGEFFLLVELENDRCDIL
jgi:hypothetical protein